MNIFKMCVKILHTWFIKTQPTQTAQPRQLTSVIKRWPTRSNPRRTPEQDSNKQTNISASSDCGWQPARYLWYFQPLSTYCCWNCSFGRTLYSQHQKYMIDQGLSMVLSLLAWKGMLKAMMVAWKLRFQTCLQDYTIYLL